MCRSQGAEEFRDAKRVRDGVGEKLQPLPPAKRQRGVAFGSGVADEDDVYGMVSWLLELLSSRLRIKIRSRLTVRLR